MSDNSQYRKTIPYDTSTLRKQINMYNKRHTVNSRENIFYKFKLPEVQIDLHFG